MNGRHGPAHAPLEGLAARVAAGDRASLARALTLVESTRPEDQLRAEDLLLALAPHARTALRLGISGPPGVGKSTLLEALGLRLVETKRVAVLAIDPSSPRSGGSILGDKTRMERLARHERAFIRPSPAGSTLGGVAARTREAVTLCEAAGHDVVIVETVGVGQSEAEVADLTDYLLLLVQPGSGDELQGIKKGIVELADALAVTKADGEQRATAEAAQAEFAAALRMLDGAERPVFLCSAREGTGIAEIWHDVETRVAARRHSGELQARRERQAVRWFERALRDAVLARFFADARVGERIAALRADVAAGKLAPLAAARQLAGTPLP